MTTESTSVDPLIFFSVRWRRRCSPEKWVISAVGEFGGNLSFVVELGVGFPRNSAYAVRPPPRGRWRGSGFRLRGTSSGSRLEERSRVLYDSFTSLKDEPFRLSTGRSGDEIDQSDLLKATPPSGVVPQLEHDVNSVSYPRNILQPVDK
ncbi:50S ribosomal protein L3 [Striga asiatica]|uniref:50S ribosomal protein L3 n=1 Tax=Striga asiatica TaxID=4170 RepID=A0A5A7PBJ6_STRAF|nr:50S ribosomal protein L3 [Striga asiatica]